VVLGVPFIRDFFELSLPTAQVWWVSLAAVAVGGAVVVALPFVIPGLRPARQHTATTRYM
jgi:hypothetical protein